MEINIGQNRSLYEGQASRYHGGWFTPRGTSLIGNSVRDFCRTKGFTRIFDGFFLKTNGFFPKVYEIFWE